MYTERMSIEKDISSRIPMGQLSLQSGDNDSQIIDVYQLAPDLPKMIKREKYALITFVKESLLN